MNRIIKQAWIDKEEKIISFAVSSRGSLFTAEEKQFWKTVMELCDMGYRIR